MDGITFEANLNKIETTRDGGWLIRFEVSQSEATQVMQLSSFRDLPLQLAVIEKKFCKGLDETTETV